MNQPPAFDPLGALEQVGQFIDMAMGYKVKCIEAGFSVESAEAMAVAFHNRMWNIQQPKPT